MSAANCREIDEGVRTRTLLELAIRQLSDTTYASNPHYISRLQGPPSPSLLSDYQARNFPVIFTDAFTQWPAHEKWCAKYYEQIMGDDEVTVAMTPHGNADSITEEMFVMPHECKTTMSEMLQWLKNPVGDVRYLQLQNGSLHLEFQKLARDVDAYGPIWAQEAFATRPTVPDTLHSIAETSNYPDTQGDAANCLGNIWIGNHRSTTSLHHDPYENIYVQIRGAKKFTLYPPCEYHWLNERRYRPARYIPDDHGRLNIQPIQDDSENLSSQVPWLSGPDHTSGEKRSAQGMQVVLQPGETLYLPALWFHTVEQIDDDEGLCVAVNYWYDLDYNSSLWRHWRFIRKMSMLAHGRLDELQQELDDEEDL